MNEETLTPEGFAERWGRLDYAPDANMLEELNALIRAEIKKHDKDRAKDYPDTEAAGYVFCGKCGAMKTI